MIIAIVKIFPRDEKRREVLDILLSVKGPVLVEPGCLTSCIYEEHGEDQCVLYLEQWRSMAELERHIRSGSYERILQAMELSSQDPVISYNETAETWDLELVKKVRDSNYRIDASRLQSQRIPIH